MSSEDLHRDSNMAPAHTESTDKSVTDSSQRPNFVDDAQPGPPYPSAHYNTGEYRQSAAPAGPTGPAAPVGRAAPVGPAPAGSGGPVQADSVEQNSEAQNTGPLAASHPSDDQSLQSPGWQPRPSGALSAQAWSSPSSTAYPPDPTGTYGTGRYSAENAYSSAGSAHSTTGQFGAPTGQFGTATGYPAYGPEGMAGAAHAPKPTDRGVQTGTATRPGLNRALAAAVAAVLVFGGAFGAGVWGANVAGDNAVQDSSLSQQSTSPVVSDTQPVVARSVESVAAKLLPSVVSILSTSSTESGEGSGIILSADGLILTNNHVIAGANDLTVRFNDGTTASAKVIGADATDDLAVIKATGVSGLTVATLGSSANVKVGEQVVAVGSPLGLSATVTSGIVSALNRPVRTAAEQPQQDPSTQGQTSTAQDTVLNAIQTDAAINPGNSGGALVNMSGAVVGINSAIASLSSGGSSSQSGSIGVGFAIPIDQAHRIAQEIVNTGHASHAVLGASVGDAPDSKAANPAQAARAGLSVGAKVASVTNGGGAAGAGLRAGDIITKVGKSNVGSADALIATIRSSMPGVKVEVTYVRGSTTKTATVTLGSAVSK